MNYLISVGEEKAEEIWSLGLLQCFTSFDEGLLSLVGFIEQHIELNKNDKQTVLILWQQIIKIVPNYLAGHLNLLVVACELKVFSAEKLAYLGTVALINSIDSGCISQQEEELLLRATLSILEFPTALSLDFLRSSIPLLVNLPWCDAVMAFANSMVYDKQLFSYGVEIAEICLQYSPNNLFILNDLIRFYGLRKDQDALLRTARNLLNIFRQQDFEPDFGFYLSSRLLSAFMTGNDWEQVQSIASIFKDYFILLQNEKSVVLNNFLRDRFWGLGFSLLYLFDEPESNRRCLNFNASIFQQNLTENQNKTICQEENLPKKKQVSLKRIGYIAHTLRQHSVGWLCRWLFKYHDREKFEIFVYLIGQPEDELTENWIYPNVSKYYHFGRDKNEIIKQIKQDQIQILVDLDVLTHNITAQVLAHKPAPVQVSWLGSDASGLPAIDYFIVDPYVVPDDAEGYYREKLWRLPQTYLAVDGFEMGTPTLSREQLGIKPNTVIYLSVQNKIKSNPNILKLQLQILQSVPDSVFLIKGGGDNELIRAMVEQLAKEMGLDLHRIRFLPKDGDEMTHRANLSIADVVLDTYPYNGATTTLETLWMEVPLVTRVGKQFASRNSYTFLTQLNIREGLAWNDQEYVYWGTRFGLEKSLREKVKNELNLGKYKSKLWRAKDFTQELELAYEGMWNGDLD